ncbi:MAG: M20/M25/M40 family metallo-hydrolase [Bacteroidia bacterium]|nr:M20/M25/M40 family metallo-hydrolase [Bacteroidia bacterium]
MGNRFDSSPLARRTVVAAMFLIASLPAAGIAQGQQHFGIVSELPLVTKTLNTDFSLDSLQTFLKQLCGELPVMVHGTPTSIPHRFAGNGSQEYRDAARHIANVFERYGLHTVLENNRDPYTRLNVIGTLPGRRAEYVMICAHYDSRFEGCPGTDDNASGTAAVLEAARLLHDIPFEYSIKFVAFGGEELGLLGSKAYVAAHGDDSIRAVINLDMIAWDGNANRVVQVHSEAPTDSNRAEDLFRLISDVDDVYGLLTEVALVRPGIGASDHAPFWDAGHPAVLLIEEFGSDFNPYYHSEKDNWINMSAEKHQLLFRSITQLAIGSVMHLASPMDPLLHVAASADHAAGMQIFAYPNPTHGRTSIAWSSPFRTPVVLVVTDLLGREVFRAERQAVGSTPQIEAVDFTSLPHGMYLLRLSGAQHAVTEKLLLR